MTSFFDAFGTHDLSGSGSGSGSGNGNGSNESGDNDPTSPESLQDQSMKQSGIVHTYFRTQEDGQVRLMQRSQVLKFTEYILNSTTIPETIKETYDFRDIRKPLPNKSKESYRFVRAFERDYCENPEFRKAIDSFVGAIGK